ncbi:hypothetical protein Tco_0860311 [Tanacetum coccineum]|uniref:Reverse transcriptase domain-containing protein n=1 Tax=Tanacetum coccineum TaxID=301880 RepID=A0ABQ5BKA6_9ASTR
MKEQAYNIIKTKDSRTQRQSNLKKFKEARFKISPHEFEDHTLGEIVSLKICFGTWKLRICKKPRFGGDRRKQIHNEDLRTEFEYFSEDYDEEREMKPRPEPNSEATPTLQPRYPMVRMQRERVVEFEEAPNRKGSRGGRNAEGLGLDLFRASFECVLSFRDELKSMVRLTRGDKEVFGVQVAYKEVMEVVARLLGGGSRHLLDINIDRIGIVIKIVGCYTKSPREILATEKAARSFEQPPRMFGSRRSRDMSKYCHFHEDHGHDTNDCLQLRNHIEEAMKSGQLSHLVKGIKKERVKASENQRTEGKKDKSTTLVEAPILMIRQDESYTKNKVKGLTSEGKEITFPSGGSNSLAPVVIKAKIFGREVNRVHMDGESSCKETPPEVEKGKKGVFSCTTAEEKVVVNNKYLEQAVIIEKQLPEHFKERLRYLLMANADVFAWTHTDMTGIPRIITVKGNPFNTEHKLNEDNHIKPIKQKRRGLGPDRSTTTCKEVEELMKAGIL